MSGIHRREAVQMMKIDGESAKTRVAFHKLSGLGGIVVDEDEAVALLEERVKDHDSEAMWLLGLCCEYGRGIKQDTERAELLYKRSCEAGNQAGKILVDNNENERGSGVMIVKGL